MNECLVTKLKSSVNDDNLRLVGEIRVVKNSGMENNGENCYIGIASSETMEATILNEGYFCLSTGEKDVTVGKTKDFTSDLWVSAGSVVRIAPRYMVTRINFSRLSMDLSDLSYLENLTNLTIKGNGIKGNIESLSVSPLSDVQITDTGDNVVGSLESIKDLSKLTSISINRTRISGDIAKCFGKSVGLSNMQIAESEMSGSIESFVAKQISNGRTSGTVYLPYAKLCGKVTFEGLLLKDNSNVPAQSANNSFSWTSNGTITWS